MIKMGKLVRLFK